MSGPGTAPAAAPDTLLEQGEPETVELVAQLIARQMRLAPGVCQVYNEKRRLPPTTGLFVDVAIIGSRPFGVNTKFEDVAGFSRVVEVQTINNQELLQVDIFSYDASARLRKLDLIFALQSTEAQQMAEKYAFQVGRIPPSFADASEVEASKRLNRFAITFNVLRAYSRRLIAPTFTDFQNPPKRLLTNP